MIHANQSKEAHPWGRNRGNSGVNEPHPSPGSILLSCLSTIHETWKSSRREGSFTPRGDLCSWIITRRWMELCLPLPKILECFLQTHFLLDVFKR